MTVKLFYSDHFPLPLPDGHRFPMDKYRLLRDRISNSQQLQCCQLLTPSAADDDQLSLAHSSDYIRKVVEGDYSDVETRRLGFPWSQQMVERSRRSTGATIDAARSAIKDGVSGNLAGGTHHAFPGSGQGYCVFNDVCVAARVLKNDDQIRNALVIDCDVHQGNGTAFIAANDPNLFTFSMHCDKNYPFRKTASDLDVALPQGAEDQQFLEALRMSLGHIKERFKPEIVFYLAGADPFEDDRLGLLNLSKSGLARRDELVFEFCETEGVPVAFCMAGGYAPDVNDIVDIHFQTVLTAAKFHQSRGPKSWPG